MKGKRIFYAGLLALVVALGLWTRSGSALVPAFFKEYAGDALWATAAYLALAFVFPRQSVKRLFVAALVISFGVELSQLYQAPWINQIRKTRPGALLLGQGFLWTDFVCYAAGAAIGAFADLALRKKKPAKAKRTDRNIKKKTRHK